MLLDPAVAALACVKDKCRAIGGMAAKWAFDRYRAFIGEGRVVEVAELVQKPPNEREQEALASIAEHAALREAALGTAKTLLEASEALDREMGPLEPGAAMLRFCAAKLRAIISRRVDGADALSPLLVALSPFAESDALWARQGVVGAAVGPARVELGRAVLTLVSLRDVRAGGFSDAYEAAMRGARVEGRIPKSGFRGGMAGPLVEWLSNTEDGRNAVPALVALHKFFLAHEGVVDQWAANRTREQCLCAVAATRRWLASAGALCPRTIAPFNVTKPLFKHQTAILALDEIEGLLRAGGPYPVGALFAKSPRHGEHLELRVVRRSGVATQAALNEAVDGFGDDVLRKLLKIVLDVLPGDEDDILAIQALVQCALGPDYPGGWEFHSEIEIPAAARGPHVDFAVYAVQAVLACLPPVLGGFAVGALGGTARSILTKAVAAAPVGALRLADDSGLHVPHPAYRARNKMCVPGNVPPSIIGFEKGYLPLCTSATRFLILRAAGETDHALLADVLWHGALPPAIAAATDEIAARLISIPACFTIEQRAEIERLALIGTDQDVANYIYHVRALTSWRKSGKEPWTATESDALFGNVYARINSRGVFWGKHTMRHTVFLIPLARTPLAAAKLVDTLTYLVRGDYAVTNFPLAAVASAIANTGPKILLEYTATTGRRLRGMWARGELYGLPRPVRGVHARLDRAIDRVLEGVPDDAEDEDDYDYDETADGADDEEEDDDGYVPSSIEQRVYMFVYKHTYRLRTCYGASIDGVLGLFDEIARDYARAAAASASRGDDINRQHAIFRVRMADMRLLLDVVGATQADSLRRDWIARGFLGKVLAVVDVDAVLEDDVTLHKLLRVLYHLPVTPDDIYTARSSRGFFADFLRRVARGAAAAYLRETAHDLLKRLPASACSDETLAAMDGLHVASGRPYLHTLHLQRAQLDRIMTSIRTRGSGGPVRRGRDQGRAAAERRGRLLPSGAAGAGHGGPMPRPMLAPRGGGGSPAEEGREGTPARRWRMPTEQRYHPYG